MQASIDLTAIAPFLAERVVYCLVEGVLIAAFAVVLLSFLRRGNAGTRFAVWFSALVAIAMLPLLGSAAGTSAVHAQTNHAAITLPGSWALYVFLGWAAIAAIAMLRVGAGLWQLSVLRRSCEQIDSANLPPLLRETLNRFQPKRGIAFCVSERVHAPVAIGLARPAVVMPRDLMEELPAEELNQLLLHELAHLCRWDDWTNLAQKIVKALLFFHPAVWWIEQRVSLEREIACDDLVLAETASPRAYAECLAHLAEKSFLRRSAALAQAAVSRFRQTSLRVARILDSNRASATTQVWRPAVALVGAFGVACLVFAVRAPKLVAFDGAAPRSVASLSPLPEATAGLKAKALIHNAVFETGMPSAVESREVAPAKIPATRASATPQAFATNRMPKRTAPVPHAILAKAFDGQSVASETFVFFVQSSQDSDPSQATYQLMWRVTVVHFTTTPSQRNSPRKVT